jgi:hypothetical protein
MPKGPGLINPKHTQQSPGHVEQGFLPGLQSGQITQPQRESKGMPLEYLMKSFTSAAVLIGLQKFDQ